MANITTGTRARLDVALGDPTSGAEVATILNNTTGFNGTVAVTATGLNNIASLMGTTTTTTASELNAWHSSGITATAAANLVTNQPNYGYSLGSATADVATINTNLVAVTFPVPTTISQAAGQTIEAQVSGIFANTTTGKQLNVYFGPNGTASDTAIVVGVAKTTAHSSAHWTEYCQVIFEGTTGVKCIVETAFAGGAVTAGATQAEATYTRITGITAGTTQYLTFAISGTTSDVTLKMAKCVYKP